MGLGVSIFLIAAGAILAFAVHVTNSHGIDLNTVGVILVAVGGFGVLLSLTFWGSWGGFGGYRREITYHDDGLRPARRRIDRIEERL